MIIFFGEFWRRIKWDSVPSALDLSRVFLTHKKDKRE
jgi:hypothetical protein